MSEQDNTDPVLNVPEQVQDGDNRIDEVKASTFEEVTQVSQFATQIFNWHVDMTNQLKHIMAMPREKDGGVIAIAVFDPEHPDSLGYGTDPAVVIPDEIVKGVKLSKGWRALSDLTEVNAFMHGIRCAFDLVADLPFKFLPTNADGNTVPEYTAEAVENENATGQEQSD